MPGIVGKKQRFIIEKQQNTTKKKHIVELSFWWYDKCVDIDDECNHDYLSNHIDIICRFECDNCDNDDE